jgi:hypothetical protein
VFEGTGLERTEQAVNISDQWIFQRCEEVSLFHFGTKHL